MGTDDVRQGKTTIAPEVLLTIARLSALGANGVARTGPVPGGVNRLFKRGVDDGVRIEFKDQAVSVDLYLVIEHDRNVRDVSRAVQAGQNPSSAREESFVPHSRQAIGSEVEFAGMVH